MAAVRRGLPGAKTAKFSPLLLTNGTREPLDCVAVEVDCLAPVGTLDQTMRCKSSSSCSGEPVMPWSIHQPSSETRAPAKAWESAVRSIERLDKAGARLARRSSNHGRSNPDRESKRDDHGQHWPSTARANGASRLPGTRYWFWPSKPFGQPEE